MKLINSALSFVQDASNRLLFGVERQTDKNHFYDVSDENMKNIESNMSDFEGKVLCVVNVASKWALTDANYSQLVKLHDEYHSQGFEVLAFPCNQFGAQEPGTDEEILQFASKYDADSKFKWFTKGHVNGAKTREVYSFLKKKHSGDIRWNFATFLVDREGTVTNRFTPTKTVYDTIKPHLEQLLEEKGFAA